MGKPEWQRLRRCERGVPIAGENSVEACGAPAAYRVRWGKSEWLYLCVDCRARVEQEDDKPCRPNALLAVSVAAQRLLDAWVAKAPLAWQPENNCALLEDLRAALKTANSPAQSPVTECPDLVEGALFRVRNALGGASNELNDVEVEARYLPICRRLSQFIDAATHTLTELINSRSGDYDAK